LPLIARLLCPWFFRTVHLPQEVRCEARHPSYKSLRELGYIEGQNIAIEYRYSEGKRGRLPELAAELVRLKVDIIVAGGGDPSIRAAKNATRTIPIVMKGGGLDPVEAGYVESLARPGGNVTGFTNLTRELGGKNGWSCSKKLFRELPVSRFSTIQLIRPVYVRRKSFSQSRRAL
jgi:ABC transporter substrate binding protein